MLVLQDPGGIFVLKNTAPGDGLDAAVTTGGGTGTGADIFNGLGGIGGGRRCGGRSEEQGGEDQRAAKEVVVAERHEVRKSSFCLYRREAVQVNGKGWSFTGDCAKRQRAAILEEQPGRNCAEIGATRAGWLAFAPEALIRETFRRDI